MNIQLFGSNCPTGKTFLRYHKKYLSNVPLNIFSRDNGFDFRSYETFNPPEGDDNYLLVSFAPIWLFSKFIKDLVDNQSQHLKDIKGIIVCSSSSTVTKKYSSNQFDKNLSSLLAESENILLSICKGLNIKCIIVRPTMIYGRIGDLEDNNISLIKKLLKYSPFIIFPSSSGLRQPIHISQLSAVFIKFIKEFDLKNKDTNTIINLGGDYEVTYLEILKLINTEAKSNIYFRYCFIFQIPNRFFNFLCLPIILVSPKVFDSLLRINSNLSGFVKSNSVLKTKPLNFPLSTINEFDI